MAMQPQASNAAHKAGVPVTEIEMAALAYIGAKPAP
jgi:hypothetical protein